jgi:hypothetical protein
MELSYANMRRRRFDADLNAKPWVILVRSADDRLVGFSTQTLLEVDVGGERVHALYSGDTVIDREHWGDPALAHAWGNFALALIARQRSGLLFWFLTSKGFRTYRYLPLFFREFFPRPSTRTPDWENIVIDALGGSVGRERYDPSRKIIRAKGDGDFVRPAIATPGLRSGTDPHVRFFMDRNPGYARGDELCCLASLTRENFTRAAYRVIHSRSVPASSG